MLKNKGSNPSTALRKNHIRLQHYKKGSNKSTEFKNKGSNQSTALYKNKGSNHSKA